ncbi:hypothetical protein C8J98_10536 [Luteibacter sp. OK325]|uniref:hypothetical protein n=1 Tax=Luteibacter sp. OK325 TaxID=2135670 RepID=UPI000D3C49C4|nr:hypothetical protein [Luteibacter sp. OK325]PTR32483.1 hypothetical protein C8J98_10536 [Luteibacter sp. OK325]
MDKIETNFLERIKATDDAGGDVGDVVQEFLDEHIESMDYVDFLSHLCEMGGSPDENGDVQVRVTDCVGADDKYHVLVEVFFDEKVYGGGCPDMPTIAPRTGEAEFTFAVDTGVISWKAAHEYLK